MQPPTQAAAPLGQEEHVAQLWKRYKSAGDGGAKNELLLHYTHLVQRLVRRMMPRYNNYNEYDDLVNCGIIGLIDAVEKFDLSQGVKFETYAITRIRGEILDYMREQDWAPSSLRKKISAISAVYEAHESTHGGPPTDAEVAEALGMNTADVRKVLSKLHAFNLLYFDEPVAPGYTLAEVATSGELGNPDRHLLKEEAAKLLSQNLSLLPEKERLVLTLYYYEELMFKDIAELLGVSESRVSQLHTKALLKLRSKLQKLL